MSSRMSPDRTGCISMVSRRAADPRRGGVLLPPSPGQADRVPGAVRAERGEIPPRYQELGPGYRHPADAVCGRLPQGDVMAPCLEAAAAAGRSQVVAVGSASNPAG